MNPRVPKAETGIVLGLDAISFDTPEEAIEHFEDLLFQAPRNATAHRELAKLYRESGRISEAREHEAAATSIRDHPVEPPGPRRHTRTKRKRSSGPKAQALAIALVMHVIFLGLLALWLIDADRPGDAPLRIHTVASGEEPDPSEDLLRALRQKPRPIEQAGPISDEIAANVPQSITIPPIDPVDLDGELFSDFGAPLSVRKNRAGGINGRQGAGGTVEFFGIRSQAERVVFIVDFSSSMLRGQRLPRLKRELNKALASMPDGMLYNIIYYSDNAWLAETRGGTLHRRNLPETARWLVANPSAKQLSSREVEWMQAEGTTFWAPPLRLALSMDPKPDLIWLLSDGDAADRKTLLSKLGRMVGDGIRINTIGMELGGVPFQSLVDIAEKTGGDYSIIIGGTQHNGKDALRFTHPVYGQPEN